ncbi:hypothetical protein SAMN05192529_10965 [Arachidicoccus rhizosphaerae]|uniref:Uncharacterized protein n=1 Tax=Arachidicoccus rhizosphaerae TaxID=551991 RepID=A0A1H3YUK7_9BACT|nr:hypothetical protein [Arachidicoccus rhizosphaerae]SEA15233.1 hypothetical protein SAMN05192529_10965 [Arachidicoccus rhizosphaerae]
MPLANIIDICIPLDIAILSIAYPIILDKLSNFGDRYGSEYLENAFNLEYPQKKVFTSFENSSSVNLISGITLISFLLLIFPMKPIILINCWVINNSADLIVLVCTGFLLFTFIKFIDLVRLYTGKSTDLLKHVISQYYKFDNGNYDESIYLKCINELSYYSVEKQDEHLQETLLKFYYGLFSRIRRNSKTSEDLIYPSDLYFMTYKLSEISVNTKKNKLAAIEDRAVSGSWLLGNENVKISEQTYNWLWRNLLVIHKKKSMIRSFWANSFNYYMFTLRAIDEEYRGRELVNENEIRIREEERRIFIQFHLALGGLLLYRSQYASLKYIFEYSQSTPPNYVLFPQSMTSIFYWFEYFYNDFSFDSRLQYKYPFPGLNNLGNGDGVKMWICRYIALLFVRQFFIDAHYVYQKFTDQPVLPNEIVDLMDLQNCLPYFKSCLAFVIQNKGLLETVSFISSLEEKYYQFLTNLEDRIKDKTKEVKLNAKLSKEKIEQFNLTSNMLLSEAVSEYRLAGVFTDHLVSGHRFIASTIEGTSVLLSKSAFVEGDIPHLNFDRILADSISRRLIKFKIPGSFGVAATKRYLVKMNDLIATLTKIRNGNDDLVLILINRDYELDIDFKKHGFMVKEIRALGPGIRNEIYILREKDLPAIEFKELDGKEIDEFGLKSINEELRIYSSIVLLSKVESKPSGSERRDDPNSDSLKVRASIMFHWLVSFSEDREVIKLNIFSPYKEQGIPNDLKEIDPLV